MIRESYIDQRHTMYPCEARMLGADDFFIPQNATVYGYIRHGTVNYFVGNNVLMTLSENTYFSIPYIHHKTPQHLLSYFFDSQPEVALFIKHGYNGQETFGILNDKSGRLVYIDGCSDSLLVYPPRSGDPCLNYLHFPPKINQSYHLHPSIRLGYVIRGSGWSWDNDGGKHELSTGTLFCVEEREIHRFTTDFNGPMDIIAFHPDSDWGPTDQSHPMLNRTYITNRS